MDEANKTLMRSFDRTLRNANRSPRTRESYAEAATRLDEFTSGTPFDEVTRGQVEDFIADQLERLSPSTAAIRFRALRRMFNWMMSEGVIETSPMAKMVMPAVPEQPVPILTDAELSRLLKVCAGRGFEQRRDLAIIRLWIDTGIRLAEMAGLALEDVDLEAHDVVHVIGKGGRGRAVPFGTKTGTALDRYLRDRARHPKAGERVERGRDRELVRPLWIAQKGAMTGSGIAQMLRRRGKQADVEDLRPHRFRHTFAHKWRSAAGDDDSLMRLTGWRSRAMLHRYGASAADERAAEAHRRLGLGDRL